MRGFYLCVLLLLFLAQPFQTTAVASAPLVPPLPPEQWDREAHLWLSRAAVAEASWVAERDHALIAWTLAYRWRDAVKRLPNLRFVNVVRSYCSALKVYGIRTPRHDWVRSLPSVDEAWPESVPESYIRHWHTVQARMLKWGAGEIEDPSHGRVRHWGSPSAALPDRARAQRAIDEGLWVLLDLGDTKNDFYGYAQ